MTEDSAAGDFTATQLAHLDRLEAFLRKMADRPPQPLVRRGKIVTGDDGQPVPNLRPAAEARKLLDRLERERAAWTGQPIPKRPAG